MGLNVSKGNMYGFITHTWNTVKGACPHGCHYCYMKKWGEQKPVRFTPSELKTDLGEGNFIFVGSSCDLFAKYIPDEWIDKTLNHCLKYPKNKYLFQTKNPKRLSDWGFPFKSTSGTTIETNRTYPEMGATPAPYERSLWIQGKNPVMVTIEPIMDFDLNILVGLLRDCSPKWVNVGANTNTKVKLPEPGPDKVQELIEALQEFTEVKVKSNLKRLMPRG